MTTKEVSKKGQVVIPTALRDQLSIAPGIELTISFECLHIPLREQRAQQKYTLGDPASLLKHEGPTVSIPQIRLGACGAVQKRRSRETVSEPFS